MKKYYLTAVTGLFFAFLVGCQSTSNTIFSPRSAPQSLKAAVLTAFMNDAELAAAPIHVEAQNGTVFLSGYVKTIRQSDTAADVAAKVPGVKAVQNGLIVRK